MGSYREEHCERLVARVGAVGPRVPHSGAQTQRPRCVDAGGEARRPARRQRGVLRRVVSAHQPVLLEQLSRVVRKTRTRGDQHTQLLHLRLRAEAGSPVLTNRENFKEEISPKNIYSIRYLR